MQKFVRKETELTDLENTTITEVPDCLLILRFGDGLEF